jgi:hypothetical protein
MKFFQKEYRTSLVLVYFNTELNLINENDMLNQFYSLFDYIKLH